MAKVKWPTKSDTINYTIVVIGVSLAVAAFLGALDFIYLISSYLNKCPSKSQKEEIGTCSILIRGMKTRWRET